jgi:hypothetical protein
MTGKWPKYRIVPAILLALALAVLPGCSMLRFGYGQLDTYAAWTADEYFDLDSAQRHEFQKRFDRLFEWHRYEQLPDYAKFFAAMRSKVQKGATREDLNWFAAGLMERYRTIIKHSSADMSAMLMTVKPEQLAALQRQWDKDNQRFLREFRLEDSPEERYQARLKRAHSQIRDWIGALTPEQEQVIAAMTKQRPSMDKLRYEDRIRRQREFLQLMKQRGDPQEFAVKLQHWLIDWEQGRDSEYDRVFKEWWNHRVEMYSALARTLTPHQRAAAARRLQNHIDDFTRLSERPDSPIADGRHKKKTEGKCC